MKRKMYSLRLNFRNLSKALRMGLAAFVLVAVVQTGYAQPCNSDPGKALDFDGSNDFVDLPNGIVAGLNDFTFEGWFKLDANSTWARLFDFGNSTGINMFLTPRSNDGKPRFAITTSGNGGEQRIIAPSAVNINTWYHIAVVINSGTNTGTMYIDGVPVASNSAMSLSPSSLGTTTQNYFGESQYYADPELNGKMDEVRIWNYARTMAEINADKDMELTGSEAGLVSYYNFNQGLAYCNNPGVTSLTDIAGSNHGNLINFQLNGASSNWVGEGAAVQSCNTEAEVLNFGPGSSDYVDASAGTTMLPGGASSWSVELWVKTTNANNQLGNMVSWGRRSNNERVGIAVRNGKAAFVGESNDVTGSAGSPSINDNNWHHVAVTYGGGWVQSPDGIKIYVDGTEIAINYYYNTNRALNINSIHNLRLGKVSWPSNGEEIYGSLDEVRIWNYTRNVTEILADKDRELSGCETGLLTYYKFNQGMAGCNNATEDTLYDNAGNNDGILKYFNLDGYNSNWLGNGPAITPWDTLNNVPGLCGTFYNYEGRVMYDNYRNIALKDVYVGFPGPDSTRVYDTTDAGGMFAYDRMPEGNNMVTAETDLPWGIAVNSTDALLALYHSVGLFSLSSLQIKAADVNGSGLVKSNDALMIVERYVGKRYDFPIGDWVFDAGEVMVNGDMFNETIYALLAGDANGSWKGAFKSANASSEVLYAGTMEVDEGMIITVPVSLNKEVKLGALSLTMELPSGIEVQNIETLMDGFTVSHDIANNSLRLGAVSMTGKNFEAGSALFNMTLKINSARDLVFFVGSETEIANTEAAVLNDIQFTMPKLGVSSVNQGYSLSNYPNPFNYNTNIVYEIPQAGKVDIRVYNILGEEVSVLVNTFKDAGTYEVVFETSDLPMGTYVYQLKSNDNMITRRMIMSK